ncbi:MAG TPA: glycosyltransferase, partial [Candidatus Methanofastidiosa archaeon]|nr:glycosyltransferase [Candidatus Methanofastidiosa archaeon]
MWKDDITSFDIVHFFNPFFMSQEAKMLMDKIKGSGTKVVVTPIFTFHHGITRLMWDSPIMTALENLYLGVRKLFRNNEIVSLFDPFFNMAYLMNKADKIMVNSRLEMENSIDFLDIPRELFVVVPNGIDSKFMDADKTEFVNMIGRDDYILYAGRIEPIKNVLSLIEAFVKSGLPTKLVIVGDPKDADYVRKCEGAANEDVMFLPHIPYDSTLLPSAYAGARVFALPSYQETCGMSGLEAGLAGANVVVTERGGTKEYYGEHATYIDPFSVES